MPSEIHFRYNQPVTLKIADPDPDCQRFDMATQQGVYQTTDGRNFTLPRAAVVKLLELAPAAGDEIGICKREDVHGAVWDLWLTSSTENARASEAETALQSPEVPSDTELLLEASLKRQKARNAGKPTPIRKREPKHDDQPRLFDRGTGTDGPALQPRIAAIRQAVAHPPRVPYATALLHIVKTVDSVLEQTGQQWQGKERQDLCSTILIAAKNQIEYDFTKEPGK